MSDNAVKAVQAVAIAFAVVGVAVALFGAIVLTTVHVQKTSREHQQQTDKERIACIQAGGSVSHGDCLLLRRP